MKKIIFLILIFLGNEFLFAQNDEVKIWFFNVSIGRKPLDPNVSYTNVDFDYDLSVTVKYLDLEDNELSYLPHRTVWLYRHNSMGTTQSSLTIPFLEGGTKSTKVKLIVDKYSHKSGFRQSEVFIISSSNLPKSYEQKNVCDGYVLTISNRYYCSLSSIQTKENLCEGDNLPILITRAWGNEDADLEIRELSSSYYHTIPKGEDITNFDNFESFVNKSFHKSVFVNDDNGGRFAIRFRYEFFETNEIVIPPFYRQESFSSNNISLIDNELEINNISNTQSATITATTGQLSSDIQNNKPITLKKGIYEISISNKVTTSCPKTFFVNVMEAKNNYLNGSSDMAFWSEKHKSRDDAVSLWSLLSSEQLTTIRSLFYNNSNLVYKRAEVSRVQTISGPGSSDPDGKLYDTEYHLKDCNYNETEQQVTITYPEGSNYLPQTIHYTLDKYFKNIAASAKQIDPECNDGSGTLVLSEIHGGLNNGYYYTLNRNNTIIEESTISGNSVSINVQNGDRVKIYDNKKKENELFPYTEERAWPDTNGYVVSGLSAIQPSFSYPSTNIICFGGKTEQVVEIMLF